MVITPYNFKAWPVYDKTGHVPIGQANAAASKETSESAWSLCRYAAEKGLSVTYSAQPMNKPEDRSFGDRWLFHRKCFEAVQEAVLLHGVRLDAILYDNEIKAADQEAQDERLKEAMAWRDLAVHYFPQVPLIQYRWNECGYYIPEKHLWETHRYWSGPAREIRGVVDCVCYHPHLFRATWLQLSRAAEEAEETGLPLAVWLSLGVGYGEPGKIVPVEYPVEDSRFLGQLLSRVAQHVCLWPSPGDPAFVEAMTPHLEAFLAGCGA